MGSDGGIRINHDLYDVSVRRARHALTCMADAEHPHFQIWLAEQFITYLPIKGVIQERLP
ncbi:MAG: hypothetical protein J2P36_27950 [Ktedonobacteraceae bacterium]|nr:hypothetical protein [Ktedonobacteraceae bacterium]